mmetsp:Transcript_43248/g.97553  ORF Transcript_43248/g.97553 Transcript_43248/m.97553 type:complete len:234 (+) Transcript_43248:1042-1743(+)
MQRKPIFRRDEQLEDRTMLLPRPRKLHWELLTPSNNDAQALRLCPRPPRIRAAQLRRYCAQHRDAVLRCGLCHPIDAGLRIGEHCAGCKGQCNVQLPKSRGTPISGGVLQDSVGASDAPLEDGRIILHLPKSHGVGHYDALAMLRRAARIAIEQHALWAKWWGHPRCGNGAVWTKACFQGIPQARHLEHNAIRGQPWQCRLDLPVHNNQERSQLACRAGSALSLSGFIGHVLT